MSSIITAPDIQIRWLSRIIHPGPHVFSSRTAHIFNFSFTFVNCHETLLRKSHVEAGSKTVSICSTASVSLEVQTSKVSVPYHVTCAMSSHTSPNVWNSKKINNVPNWCTCCHFTHKVFTLWRRAPFPSFWLVLLYIFPSTGLSRSQRLAVPYLTSFVERRHCTPLFKIISTWRVYVKMRVN